MRQSGKQKNVARVSGAAEAGKPAAAAPAEPAMLAGASPDSSAGVAEPHCPDAKRPGNLDRINRMILLILFILSKTRSQEDSNLTSG